MRVVDEMIVEGGTPTAAPHQCRQYLRSVPYLLLTDAEIDEIVAAFQHWGRLVGVRWDVAFAQSCHETNRYQFGGHVALVQHNPAGIGATNDGAAGLTYPNWRTGIAAYFIHLMAWCERLELASLIHLGYRTLDPRIPLVQEAIRTKGAATTWASLGGRWAVPGHEYGAAIERHHTAILAVPSEELGGIMPPQPPIDRSHPSPNHGYRNGFTHRPEAIVWHVTVGGFAGSLSWLTNPASGASANYLVNKDGAIYELVKPTDSAWTNGDVNQPDRSNPLIVRWLQEGVNFNQRTIAIEMVRESSANGKPGGFTEAQHRALVALSAWLCGTFGLAPDRTHIIRHAQINAVDKKNCPGLAESEMMAWIGEIAALVNAPTPPPQDGSPEVRWGITPTGQPYVVINFGGKAKRILGVNLADIGISVIGDDDATYDRSLQAGAFQPYTRREE